MTNHRNRSKPNSRKSIKYRLDRVHNHELQINLYSSMFIEDLHLGIMPIGGKSRKSNFAIKLEPASENVEELLTEALPTTYGGASTFTEAVCDFIDMTTHILAADGKAYYEIIYFFTDEDRKEIESFELDYIPDYCIKNTLGYCWQFIPKEVLANRNDISERFNWLSRNNILVISIPDELGGEGIFNKLLSDLMWLSEHRVPRFTLENMATGKTLKGYDFSTYRKNHDIYLAKITKDLGWNARGTFDNEILELYQIIRNLRFRKTKAIFREHILYKLNQALKEIGHKIGFEAEVKTEGLPSPQEYENCIIKLLDGSLSFREAYDLMYL